MASWRSIIIIIMTSSSSSSSGIIIIMFISISSGSSSSSSSSSSSISPHAQLEDQLGQRQDLGCYPDDLAVLIVIIMAIILPSMISLLA